MIAPQILWNFLASITQLVIFPYSWLEIVGGLA